MKKLIFSTSFLSVMLFLSAVASAQEQEAENSNFSGNLTIVSDYASRGMTQTDGAPALQGSIEYAHPFNDEVSAYIGLWASNVDFNDGDEASIETDWSTGIRYTYDAWSFDVGAIYYWYPGASSSLNYNFVEFQGQAIYDFGVAAVATGLNYSPSNMGDTGQAFYPYLEVAVPLPHNFSANFTAGYQFVEDNETFGAPDYADWSAGISYAPSDKWEFSLAYSDAELNKTDCPDFCGSRVIFSVSTNF